MTKNNGQQKMNEYMNYSYDITDPELRQNLIK